MNILSFDIEEWYLEKELWGGRKEEFDTYDRILDEILDLLDEKNIKATFFCLGKIATDFPEIIKRIHSKNHEIGCHSHTHTWINKMTPSEFRKDTQEAVFALEDLIGEKVVSYRAPAFSICETNKWAFEILAECGIKNDASIFPGSRDFGGFPSFKAQKPIKVIYEDVSINEFPITLKILPVINQSMAYSGGGYFRILPYRIINNFLAKSQYTMCYFHILDLMSERTKMMSKSDYEKYFKESGPLSKRVIRYLKTNIGRKNTMSKLKKIISLYPFVSIKEFCETNKIIDSIFLY